MLIGETDEGETPCCESVPVIFHKDENLFEQFVNKFKENDNNDKNNQTLKNEKFKKFYHEEHDIFYCNKKNGINGKDCYVYNELCKECQRINQEYHKLKKNYLINGAGRVCTYRKGKMYCLGQFQRVHSENNINYINDFICNGKFQCEPCKRMQENMKQYYEPSLYKALLNRDSKLGY